MIEILSKSTRRRDLGVKRAIYERCGVAENWLVEPQRRLDHPAASGWRQRRCGNQIGRAHV